MDWAYFFGPSAFQIAVGFVIAKLFDQLSELRQDRRLRIQLSAEKERLELQFSSELRKRMFDSKFEAALRLTRLLSGSVQTIRTQMLLHVASYSEGKLDVEMFRQMRDTTFDNVQGAIKEGYDAAAVTDLLFKGMTYADLPHQSALFNVASAWQVFLQQQSAFVEWLGAQGTVLPPRMPEHNLNALEEALSQRMSLMLGKARELYGLAEVYGDAVSATIRMLGDALEA